MRGPAGHSNVSDPAQAARRDDRIRVLLLMTSSAGGVGVWAYLLTKGLSKSEFDVTVAFGRGYPMDSEFGGLGVTVVPLSLSRSLAPWTNLKGFAQIYRLLRDGDFDIVCTACSIAGVLGRAAGWIAGVPCRIWTAHAYASHPHQSWLKRGIYRLVERGMDRLTTHYVAVSESMREFGIRNRIMRPEKVSVIHNGIVIAGPPAASPWEVRAELGLRSDTLVVGTLGRLEPQKGLDVLLRAASSVRRRVRDVEFVVAGDGPLRERLEALSRELGLQDFVRFVGWQRDAARVLSILDVYCLSSLWEAFGLAAAEAMALEKPVVATRVDGVAEVVQDGETGVLVPPGDPEALAEGLVTLLTDAGLRRRMGVAGRRRVETRFTVPEMVRRYEGLFRELAAATRRVARGRA